MDLAQRDSELKEALAVYVGSLAIEARVALFGDSSLGIADRLLEAGARTVDVWDPDRERAFAEADRSARGVYVQPYPPRDAPLRPADLILVVDLGLFEDPANVVVLAREMAQNTGVALIHAANRDAGSTHTARAFDYYELFDLVAGSFTSVRMVAQLAFDGVALVALGEEADDAPAVSVDTQLAEGERLVAAFVAVASEREISLDPYSIIELPAAQPSGAEDRPAASSADLPEAQALVDALEGRLREQTARCAELEAELVLARDRSASFAAETDGLRAAADAAAAAAAGVDDLTRRAAEAQAMAGRLERAEGRAATLERELAASDDTHGTEILRLEDALRTRAQAVRSLEVELARREGIVRELVSSLDETGAAGGPAIAEPAAMPFPMIAEQEEPGERPEKDETREGLELKAEAEAEGPGLDAGSEREGLEPGARHDGLELEAERERQSLLEENARLRQRLDALALDLARREADAHAAVWTVTELESRLAAQRAELQGGGSADAGALSRALDEVDALRRALAQEHAARVRVESGAALAQARMEIEKLTVLLEQHAAEQRASPADRSVAGEPALPLP